MILVLEGDILLVIAECGVEDAHVLGGRPDRVWWLLQSRLLNRRLILLLRHILNLIF